MWVPIAVWQCYIANCYTRILYFTLLQRRPLSASLPPITRHHGKAPPIPHIETLPLQHSLLMCSTRLRTIVGTRAWNHDETRVCWQQWRQQAARRAVYQSSNSGGLSARHIKATPPKLISKTAINRRRVRRSRGANRTDDDDEQRPIYSRPAPQSPD